jgi:hypothetical protein
MPSPHRFTVKTTTAKGSKLFINVCSSHLIPPPPGWPPIGVPLEVQNYLGSSSSSNEANEKARELLRVPFKLSNPRRDSDHAGVACTVLDFVVSHAVLESSTAFRPLKLFLCSLSIEESEKGMGEKVHRQFKLPKMRSKGTIFPLKVPEKQIAALAVAEKSENNARTGGIIELIREEGARDGCETAEALSHSVEFQGRPCTSVLVAVTLSPVAFARAKASLDAVSVQVQGEEVRIGVKGCLPLSVHLPFCTKPSEENPAVLDPHSGTLQVKLQYLPFKDAFGLSNS